MADKIFQSNRVVYYLLSCLLGFFEPVGVLVFWLFFFVLVDLFVGVWASLVEGKYMTSQGLRKTAVKFFFYFLTIVLVEGIDKHMVGWGGMSKIFSALLCGVELYSILENFYRITGHKSFKILTQFTIRKIEEKIGVNIDDERN